MTRMPVTLADQGIFIEPDDADELTDLLADAGWVIGHLAGQPAAEDACARAPARPPGRAAEPSSPSTCGWPPRAWTRPRRPARKTTTTRHTAGNNPARARSARDTPRITDTPRKLDFRSYAAAPSQASLTAWISVQVGSRG
jgi:hypothetical protein